jgi:hypothetical protein
MIKMPSILIEGYTLNEILEASDDDLTSFVFTDNPLVFKIGTAEILGHFRIEDNGLIIELAQIDGGGEGVLPTLWILANRYAAKRNLSNVEWIVHAVTCAKPNPKLRHMLDRRGFVVENIEGVGSAYHLINSV